MTEPHPTNPDERNRRIEQEAQTDTELESIVPPRSRYGAWLPLALAALAVIFIIMLFMG